MIILHQVFCDHCSTIEGESELSRNKDRTTYTQPPLILYLHNRYILCIVDEVTNYIITTPVKEAKSEEVGEALISSVFSKHCVPYYMIMDLDSAFMSLLMSYLFKRLRIKNKDCGSI